MIAIERSALRSLLAESDLSQSDGALIALDDGAIVKVANRLTQCEGMLTIYRRRARHLAKYDSAHASQLARSVREFVAMLADYAERSVRFIDVIPDAEHEFCVFLLDSNDLILGCLRTISKAAVPADRWEERWGTKEG